MCKDVLLLSQATIFSLINTDSNKHYLFNSILLLIISIFIRFDLPIEHSSSSSSSSVERKFSGCHCQSSSESRCVSSGNLTHFCFSSHRQHSKTHKLKELTDGNKSTRGDLCKLFKSLNFQHLLHTAVIERTAGVLY